jgi:phosphonate degradation associated HDIG domain protein/phosphonatase-like hydrolase
MGMPKPHAIATLVGLERGTPPDDTEVAHLYTGFERMMIEHYRIGAGVREAEGATDVMRRLHASGVKVALDTGFARTITDVVVARLGWGPDVVDLTVSSDEVARGRPHPDMVLEAMKRAGVVEPARVAKVGDTPADLLEGTAAGCGFVIGVTSGSHASRELLQLPHTHLIASLRELLPIVEGWTAADGATGEAMQDRDAAFPHAYDAITGDDVADAVAECFARSGGAQYFGEPVTQREHALQCAALAERAGAPQALIVAALLHDVGHLLHGRPESLADAGVDGIHEVVGERWLSRVFGPEVTEPVRLHVDAKRYLCAADQEYLHALSPASQQSLALQGGPLTGQELSDFVDRPYALDAVRLRRWDDRAKAPGLAVPDLEHYRSLLLAVARRGAER